MTARELLLALWPFSMPDETAGAGVDVVLKALDNAGYTIAPKAQLTEAAAFLETLARRCELPGGVHSITQVAFDCRAMAARLRSETAEK